VADDDIRKVGLCESGVFLFLAFKGRRKVIRGSAPALRREILRTTFRPGLILGLHMAWPFVVALHGTAYLGTYLPATGVVRGLTLLLCGSIAFLASLGFTLGLLVMVMKLVSLFV